MNIFSLKQTVGINIFSLFSSGTDKLLELHKKFITRCKLIKNELPLEVITNSWRVRQFSSGYPPFQTSEDWNFSQISIILLKSHKALFYNLNITWL